MKTKNGKVLQFLEEAGAYDPEKKKTQNFEGLKAWESSHQFVLDVYKMTSAFPPEEKFGLTNQFRRAAVSIPANIAEGTGRGSIKDMLRFFMISRGSIEECHYFIILSRDMQFISSTESAILKEQLNQTGKLLNGLIKSLEKKIP